MTNDVTQNGMTLVVGGSGKTGRRVVQLMRQAGHAVRVGSRTGEPPFDWNERATWGPAMEGASAAYITFQPDLAVPGALETVRAFFGQAMACGVKRLVLLSGRGEVEAEAAERALRASGADWTILRASWFCQNFSESFLRDLVMEGEVALPAEPVAEPFVDADDIAEVAFAALTQPGHIGQLYELTGPRALTFADAVSEIAAETGRDLAFVQVPPDDYHAAMIAAGMPAEEADLVIYLFTTVLDGRNTPLTDGVRRALGREPRDFTDFARRAAAEGAWR